MVQYHLRNKYSKLNRHLLSLVCKKESAHIWGRQSAVTPHFNWYSIKYMKTEVLWFLRMVSVWKEAILPTGSPSVYLFSCIANVKINVLFPAIKKSLLKNVAFLCNAKNHCNCLLCVLLCFLRFCIILEIIPEIIFSIRIVPDWQKPTPLHSCLKNLYAKDSLTLEEQWTQRRERDT